MADELLARLKAAVVSHDRRGRAIFMLPPGAPPLVFDVPGMSFSGYGFGAPIEGCDCPYCRMDGKESLPTLTLPEDSVWRP